MKKIIILSVIGMFLCSMTYAIDLNMGAEADFILNRRLDLKNLNTKVDYVGQNYNIVADIELGPLTISPSAGISRCSLETANVTANSGNGWNAGVSVKATYPVMDLVDVSAIGNYRFSRNDIDEIVVGGTSIDNPLETILYMHEFEFGLLAEKSFEFEIGETKASITPYIGVVYSDLSGTVETGSLVAFEEEITARQNWGLRYGVSIKATDSISLVIAASMIDKIAVSGNVLVRF